MTNAETARCLLMIVVPVVVLCLVYLGFEVFRKTDNEIRFIKKDHWNERQ